VGMDSFDCVDVGACVSISLLLVCQWGSTHCIGGRPTLNEPFFVLMKRRQRKCPAVSPTHAKGTHMSIKRAHTHTNTHTTHERISRNPASPHAWRTNACLYATSAYVHHTTPTK